ncbi:MAG TPA: NAD-dependent epimerase/dehydratase family protein [Bacillota bacterium]
MRHALVTGGAGFIGSHLVDRLLAEGWRVTVVDNFDPFYDPAVKRANLAAHLGDRGTDGGMEGIGALTPAGRSGRSGAGGRGQSPGGQAGGGPAGGGQANPGAFTLVEADIRDLDALKARLDGDFDVIVHLAAKAGVRPSLARPLEYQEVNVRGTHNLLELARAWGVRQFVFASSSSVYGVNPNLPWREDDAVLRPISPYAATKVAGELLGHTYSHLYGIRFIALRFFTVYGPRQRPDLAIRAFARRMLEGRPLPVFGDGSSSRDYTYIDDIIAGVRAAMDYTATRYEVINLGSDRAVSLRELIAALEQVLGIRARIEPQPPQPGDVPRTWADVTKARRLLGYEPRTPLDEGLKRFARWLEGAVRVG